MYIIITQGIRIIQKIIENNYCFLLITKIYFSKCLGEWKSGTRTQKINKM